MTKCDVLELPKNGTFMQIYTKSPVCVRVGIAPTWKIFLTENDIAGSKLACGKCLEKLQRPMIRVCCGEINS